MTYGTEQDQSITSRHTFSRALVTGGAGFIGSHIVDLLVQQGIVVTVVDDFSTGRETNLARSAEKGQLSIIKGDINDVELLSMALRDVEVVFHEAAIVSVPKSIEQPELTRKVNVQGTKSLLDACSNSRNVDRLVLASSAAVYGEARILPIKESTALSPMSPYASSKLDAEKLCEEANRQSGIETINLRYFNVYGERSAFTHYSGVIYKFFNAITYGLPTIIYGDGMQTRDFVYVSDVADANLLAGSGNSNMRSRIYNVATGTETTILGLLALENEILLGKRTSASLVKFEPPRAGDIKRSVADISLSREELAFEPKVPLSEGIRRYFDALKFADA
jgi:UDP-glucose 4-epimerase